jgi:hypothetical protein
MQLQPGAEHCGNMIRCGIIKREVRRQSLLLDVPANSSFPDCVCLFLHIVRQTAEMVCRESINTKDDFLKL